MSKLDNIFKKDGRSFVLAIDHPLTMPSPDLQDPQKIINTAVSNGVDAFLANYGCIRHFREQFADKGIILRVDGGSVKMGEPTPLQLLYDDSDALRINADAMLCMGFPGSSLNSGTLKNVAQTARNAHRSGLAAGAEMLPFGFEKKDGIDTRSVENVSFACRLGAEMGADFIKTDFVGGERFREVVENCFVPILVLGGGKAKSAEELLRSVDEAMNTGASGLIMGRNIVSSTNMPALCRAISALIHDRISLNQAMKML